MRVLCTVVLSQTTAQIDALPAERPKRGTVVCPPIGDDAFRLDWLVAKQLLQQFQGCARAATLLNDEIEYLAFIIDSTQQESTLASDLAHHLVEMPPRRRKFAPAKIGRDLRTTFRCPDKDRFVTHVDAPLREHL